MVSRFLAVLGLLTLSSVVPSSAAESAVLLSVDTTKPGARIDRNPEVQVEEQVLGAFPDTITVRPFSVNIYSYPVQ